MLKSASLTDSACSPVCAIISTMPTGPAMSFTPTLPLTSSESPIHTMRTNSMQVFHVFSIFAPIVASSTPNRKPYILFS